MTNAPADEQQCRWHPVADTAVLAAQASSRILAAAGRALAARRQFHIVLAGGNTPAVTYGLLRDAGTDWRRWHVWFGDERCAPPDDPERNSRMADTAWLDHVAIPHSQRHSIPAELGAAEGASRYSATLQPMGEFDLVLLGLGGDGHTASLFPGNAWGEARGSPAALAVFNSPKPPPQRVTLCADRLGRAREVVFLVAGEDKRAAVARWREGEAIPARAIRPPAGVDVLVEATLIAPAAD